VAIHYIDKLRWFSVKASAGSKYGGVTGAIKAHIEYISANSGERGRSGGVTCAGLDSRTWTDRAEAMLAKNGRAACAVKTCFALPVGVRGGEGVDLVREFFSTRPIFAKQWKTGGKKYTERCTLPPDHVGVAVHDGTGISGHENGHAHILIHPRSQDNRSITIRPSDLSLLHKEWVGFLTEKGFQIEYDPPDIKGPHIGPDKLRKDKQARDEYLDRLRLKYLNKMLQAVDKTDTRTEAFDMMNVENRVDLAALKALPMTEVLDKLGIEWKESGGRIFFEAVWRGERKASVSAQVIDGKWLFYDRGTGEGGSNIDLLCKAKGVNVQQAIEMLAGDFDCISAGYKAQKAAVEKKEPAAQGVVIAEYDRASESVEKMLKKHRGFSFDDIHKRGAKVLKVQMPDGSIKYNLGYKTESGWELKVAQVDGFKAVIGHKDLSYHPLKNSGEILVAESLFDAVAAQKLTGRECNILSLNSTRMAMRAIDRIIAEQPARVLLALDNDDDGKKTAALIRAACEKEGIRVETAWPAGEVVKDPCAALAQVSFMNTKNGVLTAPER